MNHFFANIAARECFKKYQAKLVSQEQKSHFIRALKNAWEAKQFSEDDNLSSYSLISEDVKNAYEEIIACYYPNPKN